MATRRPLRPCRKVGCPALVRPPEAYCPAHRQVATQQRREQQRYYDTHLRDERTAAFYRSAAWERARQMALNRDKHLCQECLKHKRITAADTVHHIEPLRKAWGRRLEVKNLVSVCAACHNRLHGG